MSFRRLINLTLFALLIMAGFSLGVYAEETETSVTSGTDGTTTTTSPSGEATQTAGVSSGRPKIAVITFENPPNYYSSTIGTGMTELVVTALTKSGRFDVIQRGDNLDAIIDEIRLGESGLIKSGEETKAGNVSGVKYILSGKVTNFGYEENSAGGSFGNWGGFGGIRVNEQRAVARVDFALIDAESGLTLLAATAEGKESDTGVGLSGGDWGHWIGSVSFDSQEFADSMIGHATVKAIDIMLEEILGLFPVQAPIIAVTPGFLILDIGQGAGIEPDMIFEVYRISVVKNSSGEVVWEEKTLIGTVKITEVQLQNSKAVPVSGSGFSEGDVCILPEKVADKEKDKNKR